MKYVLDASVAVKWVLPEVDSEKAIELQEAFEMTLHELIAPDVLAVEVAHALTRAERRGALLVGEAMSRLSRIYASLPELHVYLPLLPRAVDISSRMRLGVYDCLYLALTEREGCQLITADDRLAKTAGFSIVTLADL